MIRFFADRSSVCPTLPITRKTIPICAEELSQQPIALAIIPVAKRGIERRDSAFDCRGHGLSCLRFRDAHGGDSGDWPETENNVCLGHRSFGAVHAYSTQPTAAAIVDPCATKKREGITSFTLSFAQHAGSDAVFRTL